MALPVTGANTALWFPAVQARACTARVSANEPLVSRPTELTLGSAALSEASPDVLVTIAATEAS